MSWYLVLSVFIGSLFIAWIAHKLEIMQSLHWPVNKYAQRGKIRQESLDFLIVSAVANIGIVLLLLPVNITFTNSEQIALGLLYLAEVMVFAMPTQMSSKNITTPYVADDEELIDLAIIKANEADQFKKFLANEADALQRKKINEREEAERKRTILIENNTVRSKLLDFINDTAQLEVIYMFLNRNFQLWPKHIGENGLLSLKYLYNIKSYSRTEDVIDITIEVIEGIELKFKLFHPDMPIHINAELVFEWRYTEDLNEQPVAKYDTKIVEQKAYMEYEMYGNTPINVIRNRVRDLFKIEYLGLTGHSFYAYGITYEEIRPFLRSIDYDVNFVFDESNGVVERISLNYFREQDYGFNLEQAAYDLYDYDTFYFEELTDYIAPAAYLLLRLNAIQLGVLLKRRAVDSRYNEDPYYGVRTTAITFKADYDLTWNKQ